MKLAKWFGSDRGSVLVPTLVIIMVLTILATVMLQVSATTYKQAFSDESKNKARNLAEAGVAAALKDVTTATNISDTLDGNTYTAVISGTGPYSVVATGVYGSVGNRWTSSITTTVAVPQNILDWNLTLFARGTMDFDGNAYTIDGQINSVGTVTGTHAPEPPQLTQDDIPMPVFSFNTSGLPFVPISSNPFNISSIPAGTTFYAEYNEDATLDVDGPNGTPANVSGIIKAKNIKVSGNSIIGSPTKPIILWASEGVWITGSPTIYGLIYVDGFSGITQTDTGNPSIHGMIISQNNVSIKGSADMAFDTEVRQSIFNMNLIGINPQIKSWQESYTKS